MSNLSSRLELCLKEREDEYTSYKQFYFLIGTFNVNNRQVPSNTVLYQWLYNGTEENQQKCIPDIIVVGFQEIDTTGTAYLFDDKKKEDDWEQIVQNTIKHCYGDDKENLRFELLDRVRLVGMLQFVYVRSIHRSRCTSICRAILPTGFLGMAGNKGGIGIRFRFYESDLCFINAHFASGDEQTKRRNEEFRTIESSMSFTNDPTDTSWFVPIVASASPLNTQGAVTSPKWWKICNHDIIFWLGDLNYRISQSNEDVRKAVRERSITSLFKSDQLHCEMESEHVFNDYHEPPLDFLPTYKFDLHTDRYDTSEKQRTPSWTDRILFRSKRLKVRIDNNEELETIKPINYLAANSIRFSDHRPVSGLYLVAIKHQHDEKASNRIREELIRKFDRLENDSIPTIDVHPRPPEIIFNDVRYLDKPSYLLTIKNIGECTCQCDIVPSSISTSLSCLTFTPAPRYIIGIQQEVHVNITFDITKTNRKQISDIIILRVDNGADTFITLDATLDKGPFGLALDEYPCTLYDNEHKRYLYTNNINDNNRSEHIVEMINDPPAIYITLIDCLCHRQNVSLLDIFNSEVQDALNLNKIRDQLYDNDYDFTNNSTAELFMILLHLLQALPQPIIPYEVQDKIYANRKDSFLKQDDVIKALGIIIEQLKAKERSLFFRFLFLLKQLLPTQEQIEKANDLSHDMFNVCIDVVALSVLHEHLNRQQRRAFLVACVEEETKN